MSASKIGLNKHVNSDYQQNFKDNQIKEEHNKKVNLKQCGERPVKNDDEF